MRPAVTIIQTGTANTASVVAAFRRLDIDPKLCLDPEQIRCADYLVLPGVGALAAAMHQLQKNDLGPVLQERVEQAKPLLAICLGLQILSEGSEESSDTAGLGILTTTAMRYPKDVLVPQMGWNRVTPEPSCRMIKPGYAYFANSYRLPEGTPGWSNAFSDHGGDFVAATEKGPVLACQFHPELSGNWGLELIGRWLDKGGDSC